MEARFGASAALVVAALALAGGCNNDALGGGNSGGGRGGAGGGGAGGGGAGAGGSALCAAPEVAVPKRIVRLTFNQLVTSLRQLLGDAAAQSVAAELDLGAAGQLAFPPLFDPREGLLITDARWTTSDQLAQAASARVVGGFAALTGCGDTPTQDCGRNFVLVFAERAFRRPLADDEKAS